MVPDNEDKEEGFFKGNVPGLSGRDVGLKNFLLAASDDSLIAGDMMADDTVVVTLTLVSGSTLMLGMCGESGRGTTDLVGVGGGDAGGLMGVLV